MILLDDTSGALPRFFPRRDFCADCASHCAATCYHQLSLTITNAQRAERVLSMLPPFSNTRSLTAERGTQEETPEAHGGRRIIPLRRPEPLGDWPTEPSAASDPVVTSSSAAYTPSMHRPFGLETIDLTEERRQRRPEEAGRHFLKFMLPAIPIAAFVMTFLYYFLLAGLHAPLAGDGADPTLALLGALLLALTTGMLAAITYLGYQRACDRQP